MRFNSEFGWDPIAKKFTASDEVWEDYFKAHPTHRNYQTDTFTDYEYLEIATRNRTATRSHAIGLGEETDARTIETKDNKGGLDDLTYDPETKTFIQSDTHDTLPHSSSTINFTSHLINSEVLPTTKKNKMNIEGKSSSFEPNSCQSDVLNNIVQNIGELKQTIASIESREVSCWDVIKEIPNLDQCASFKVLKLLNTRAKRMDFLKMTPEERSDWINFLLEEYIEVENEEMEEEIQDEKKEEELHETIRIDQDLPSSWVRSASFVAVEVDLHRRSGPCRILQRFAVEIRRLKPLSRSLKLISSWVFSSSGLFGRRLLHLRRASFAERAVSGSAILCMVVMVMAGLGTPWLRVTATLPRRGFGRKLGIGVCVGSRTWWISGFGGSARAWILDMAFDPSWEAGVVFLNPIQIGACGARIHIFVNHIFGNQASLQLMVHGNAIQAGSSYAHRSKWTSGGCGWIQSGYLLWRSREKVRMILKHLLEAEASSSIGYSRGNLGALKILNGLTLYEVKCLRILSGSYLRGGYSR
ncbi:hypothetical protein FNV43_RR00064 [Rhamnella rubrinervis]|uniref:At2g29880-like C-terminal domain-containing protein n=1 Tax=Rhamnella rubrinervis TaxID=2594499 RepID=A0A8K0MR29_9ROSA|nr:hypothetical protein FNV43_RR00064 [Rhamnella rubrinervis]